MLTKNCRNTRWSNEKGKLSIYPLLETRSSYRLAELNPVAYRSQVLHPKMRLKASLPLFVAPSLSGGYDWCPQPDYPNQRREALNSSYGTHDVSRHNLCTSINNAWSKLEKYYNRTDRSRAYFGSVRMHSALNEARFSENWNDDEQLNGSRLRNGGYGSTMRALLQASKPSFTSRTFPSGSGGQLPVRARRLHLLHAVAYGIHAA